MSGFIEFSLANTWKQRKGGAYDYDLPVICFSSQKFADCAIEIKGDKMPETWLDGYKWKDLNILEAAYIRRDNWNPREEKENLRDLYTFIHAFGFQKGDKMFMHIWKSRLPVT